MEYLFIATLTIIALAIFAVLIKKQPKDSGLSYQTKEVLFTQAERSFLGVLEQALDGRRYRVFGKVRLEDIVVPAKGLSRSNMTTARNKINQKHVDFIICTTDDLALVAVIELDDKSHERKKRVERDQFLDRVLQEAKIPIAHFSAKRGYAIHEVRAKLVELGLKQVEKPARKEVPSAVPPETVTAKDPVAPPPKEKQATDIPLLRHKEAGAAKETPAPPPEEAAPGCPKCSVPMIKGKAVKGPDAGEFFWVCPKYPNCRHVVAIET